jgi:glycosyltransferase involved in cell wall biosynthesis
MLQRTDFPGIRESLSPGDQALPLDEIVVVIPVYMGSAFLPELCLRVTKALQTITDSFSIILVDDRGPDNAWPEIIALGNADKRIRGIQLSRNFGQHHAITAGIDHARARWYVVMDCDLQDAPEDIPLLYAKAQEGFDMVVAARRQKRHGFIKRTTSYVFYRVFNWLSGVQLDWSVGNYRIFSDRVADGYRQMREQLRCLPASLSFMGFEVGKVEVTHHARPSGESSYTLRKLVSFASGILLAHSHTPLTLTAIAGLIISGLSILAACAIAARTLIWGSPVTGWASLIVAVFLMGGFQMFTAGVIGMYVGKALEEAKKRPLYFIRDTSNL